MTSMRGHFSCVAGLLALVVVDYEAVLVTADYGHLVLILAPITHVTSIFILLVSSRLPTTFNTLVSPSAALVLY